MGVIVKQSFRTTIVTYLGVVIGAFNLLYLFPKLLNSEEIGLVRVLMDIGLVVASIAQFGTSSVTDKFFPFFVDDKKKHNGFFLFIVLYPLIGFLLTGGVLLLLKDLWIASFQKNSPLLIDFFYYVFPLALSIMYFQVLEAYTRIHYRIVVSNFLREIFLRLALSLIVVAYFLKWIDLDGLILWMVVSYIISLLILIGYIKLLRKLYLKFISIQENKKLFKEMLFFSLFVVTTGLTGLIVTKVDIIMLGSIKGLDTAGVYSIAFYIGTIIEIPRRALSQISVPVLSQAWKDNNFDTINHIYKKTSINQLIIGGFLFLAIWINVDYILELIPNSETYKAGKIVILIIGLSRLSDMLTGVNSEIIITSPFYKLNFIISLILAPILLLLNFLLIPNLGLEGAALSTLLGYLLSNLSRYVFLLYKVKIQPFTLHTLLIIGLGIVTYVLISILPLPERNDFVGLLFLIFVNGSLVCIVFLLPVFILKVSPEFNELILGALNKVLGKSTRK